MKDEDIDTDEKKTKFIKTLKGAVISSTKASDEIIVIRDALKVNAANTSNKWFKTVKGQIEYLDNNIKHYADAQGITRKRLLIRSIRKMMIEVSVGNNAAQDELKRLEKNYNNIKVLLAIKTTNFTTELNKHFDQCFPRSSREKTLNEAAIYRSETTVFPCLNDLEDIINLLYFAFDNVSPTQGLRLINNLFKSIHSFFIMKALDSCKSYLPHRSFTSECAKMKFSMNLLYRLRNSFFIDTQMEFKYDEFYFNKEYCKNHYDQITEMLNKPDYANWKLEGETLVEEKDKNGDRVLLSKNNQRGTLKELFGRIYNYYVINVVKEKGIAQKYNHDEIEILEKAVNRGDDSLLHILGFTRNLKHDATGRKRAKKEANKGGKRKRKTKKLRKRKTLKKRKRKGGKKVSIKKRKKNMRKTKYKK